MNLLSKLHIEKQYSSGGTDTFIIEGLSVQEMTNVLDAGSFENQRTVLATLLDTHDNDYRSGSGLGTAWLCGYGIYGIRHFGGHLIVTVGNNCD